MNITDDFIKNKVLNITLIVFILGILISEIVSSKFELNDFKVYYLAMKNFLNNQPIYGIPFGLGSGYYKYAPIALFPFSIFYFIPYYVSGIIYYSIVGVCIVIFFNIYPKIAKNLLRSEYNFNLALFITLISSLTHLHRELHLGNVNIILLLIYSYSFYLISISKKILPGIIIGIGLLFKLHFIVLIPVLLIFRKYKISLISAVTFLFSLTIIFPLKGINQSLAIYSEWINIMKFHNANILNHPDTIYFNIVKLLDLLSLSASKYLVLFTAFIPILFLFLYFVKVCGKILSINPDFNAFGFAYFFSIAMIPSLTLTDTEHFLLSLPIIYIGSALILRKKITLPYKLIFIIGLLFYGGNIHDLLGHELSVRIANNGFLGIGNLIIVVTTFIFSFKLFKINEN